MHKQEQEKRLAQLVERAVEQATAPLLAALAERLTYRPGSWGDVTHAGLCYVCFNELLRAVTYCVPVARIASAPIFL